MKEMEKDLGEQLFIRTSRSTRLTRAGMLFLEAVPRVFTALQAARVACHRGTRTQSEVLIRARNVPNGGFGAA